MFMRYTEKIPINVGMKSSEEVKLEKMIVILRKMSMKYNMRSAAVLLRSKFDRFDYFNQVLGKTI